MVEGAPLILPEAPSDTPEKKDKDEGKSKKRKPERSILSEMLKKEAEKPKRSLLEETEPVSEAKAPLEKLGAEEKRAVVQETARQKLEAAPEIPDSAEADPEAVAAEAAAQTFLAEAAESGDIKEAMGIAAAKLEIEPEELAAAAAELEEEALETEAEKPQSLDEETLVFDRHAEEEAEEENELGDAVVAATIAQTTPTAPPPQGGAGNQGPGSPPPPASPGGPLGPLPFGQGPGSAGPGGINPNLAPLPPLAKPDVQPRYHETSPAVMAVAGGIIGYLIGRRRGRIKTEKKLMPIQKKLEKQVTNLQFELQEKEKQIRRVAAAKTRREGPAIVEAFTKALPEKPAESRRKAPEARALHIPEAPEHLGHVLVAAESKPAASYEKAPEPAAKPLTERRVETLNRRELLEISEKVKVEGSSLRQIYETHLIGERGLRRLVAEHLRGGDLKKALRREIVEREIDFERDPAMRDMAPHATGSAPTGSGGPGGKATLDKLVEKAAAKVDGTNSEEAAFYKARAAYEESERHQQQKQRRIIDVSLGLVVLTLIALVAWLITNRSGSL
jgi:hypothetical protein